MDLQFIRYAEILLQIGVLVAFFRLKILARVPMFACFLLTLLGQELLLGRINYTAQEYNTLWQHSLVLVLVMQVFATSEAIKAVFDYYSRGNEQFLWTVFCVISMVSFGTAVYVASLEMAPFAHTEEWLRFSHYLWKTFNIAGALALALVQACLWIFRRVLKEKVAFNVSLHRWLLLWYFATPEIVAVFVRRGMFQAHSTAVMLCMAGQMAAFAGWILLMKPAEEKQLPVPDRIPVFTATTSRLYRAED